MGVYIYIYLCIHVSICVLVFSVRESDRNASGCGEKSSFGFRVMEVVGSGSEPNSNIREDGPLLHGSPTRWH